MAEKKVRAAKSGETVRKRLRSSDLIPRIICVLIAVVVWQYVMSMNSPDDERTFAGVPISLENTVVMSDGSDLSVIGGYGNVAEITIVGKKSQLISYSPEDIAARVDIGTITEAGKHQLPIKVTAPDGCMVKSINPTSIEVYVDSVSTKTVPVKVVIMSVQYDRELSLGVPVSDVTAVTVSGPESVIHTVQSAVVELELGTLTTGVSARGEIKLVTADNAVVDNPYVTLSQGSVGVSVPLYMEKEIPITVGTKYGYLNAGNSVVTVEPKTITVRADPKILEGVESLEIAKIDEKQISTSENQIVPIALPEGMENVSGTTLASISVTHKGTVRKGIVVENITVRNPNNLAYTVVTSGVNVVLRAPADIAEQLTADDVTLTAELNYSGISGMVQVPVSVTISDMYKDRVYEIGEYKISVQVEK